MADPSLIATGGRARAYAAQYARENDAITQRLDSILAALRVMAQTQRASAVTLETYAQREAALLPSHITEQVSVVSGQQASRYSGTNWTEIQTQTTDVEIINGIYLWIADLEANDTVSVTLQVTDELTLPFTFTSTTPQFILTPLRIPSSTNNRILTVTDASGTYTSVTALIFGHVAPARTRTVH